VRKRKQTQRQHAASPQPSAGAGVLLRTALPCPGGLQPPFKGHLKKTKKTEPVGCFYVGLPFFGLLRKLSLRVILTPPARYQHPHDANNPQVGHWGSCKPKWWPQGSTSSSSKTKQRTHKAKRGELNGLVVYGDVRIGLTLYRYGSSCRTRCELNLFFGGNKKNGREAKMFRKDTI
jgi:hypothetical protein